MSSESAVRNRGLHRQILELSDPKTQVDHISGNGLDNREINLRRCTLQENKRAAMHRCESYSSRFRGVYYDKSRDSWVAQIKTDGSGITLGRFKSEVEAAKRYDLAASAYFGDFAQLNLGAENKLWYLACPYSSPDPAISELRFQQVTWAAAELTRADAVVFSPITSSHPLHVIGGMRGDWAFWRRIDYQYIRASQTIVVLTLPGWRDSTGVSAEIRYAKRKGIPVEYWSPENALAKSNLL